MLHDNRGQNYIEYIVIATLALTVIAAVVIFYGRVTNAFDRAGTQIDSLGQ